MTNFYVWNADQPCRAQVVVERLLVQWAQFEAEGFDCSEITTLMDAWIKTDHYKVSEVIAESTVTNKEP